MHPPEAYQPTQPQPLPQTAVVVRTLPPPPNRNLQIAFAASIALVVGICIGLAIARATETAPAAPVSAAALGHLTIASTPDGNVMVDGRFVGVAPLDRLDVDPGKHSVVIDAFGYQPYAGTLVIKASDKLNLSVLLAPIGDAGGTSGKFTGTGTITRVVVPPSALMPATTPAADPKKTAPVRASQAPAPPPSRPRRDCDGEKSRCTDSCRSASTDCEFSCPGCSSCNTSTGQDECKRQCDTCHGSCSNNTKFCESSCSNQYDNCEASQR
jgi:hypothetical protein